MDSEVLAQEKPSGIAEKAAQYDVDIRVGEEKGQEQIILPDVKKQFKKVLRFLDEDYFSGTITNTKYVSNSREEI